MGCDRPKLIPESKPTPKEKTSLSKRLLKEIEEIILYLVEKKLLKENFFRGSDVRKWFRMRVSKALLKCLENKTPVMILEKDELLPHEKLKEIFSVYASEELLNTPPKDLEEEAHRIKLEFVNYGKLKIGLNWELLPGDRS